jgi:hypothetical protein
MLASSLSASQVRGSVQFVDRTTVGSDVQTLDGAISAPTAGETLTGAGTPLVVELISSTVYVNGSASALESALQITAAQATPVANKWIAVATTDAPFQSLTGALTLSSTLTEFTPTKQIHFGKQTKVGKLKVIPIIGRPSNLVKGASGSAALLVSAKAPHLPVGGTLVLAQGKQRLHEVAVFSNWGAKVSLTAPAGAVPFSSVLTG